MSYFKTWSNASLGIVQSCGHKFYLKYIQKDRRPSGYAAKRGIAVHKVASEAHKFQMALRGEWPGDPSAMTELPGTARAAVEARDLAAQAFERAVSEGGVAPLKPEEREVGEAVVRAHQKDASVDLAALYVTEIAPPIQPVAVERKIVVKPRDMDITLTGYLDLVEDDAGDVIRDLKTAEKAPWKGAADVSQQLTMYHMIRMAEKGRLAAAGKLVHLVRTPKTHELSAVTQETRRDAADLDMLVRRINVAIDSVEKGVFVPADPSAPGSPCSWCEYADGTCVYVRRKGDRP